MTHKCRVCKEVLTDNNWYISRQKKRDCICKRCSVEKCRLYRKNNPEKAKAYIITGHRKNGQIPMNENKKCPVYFGVYFVEGALCNMFNNVIRMPYGNPGFDFICNRDKKIDSKGACTRKNTISWEFTINYNTIADYFICVAFDNRQDLNPLHIWMLPGDKFNHLKTASISKNTLHKWSKYEQPINEMIACCNERRN